MKTKFISKATTFTYIAFVACCILFLLSCGGCGSGKVANLDSQIDPQTSTDKNYSVVVADQKIHHDTILEYYYNSLKKGIYIQIARGIDMNLTFETNLFQNYSTMTFPDGNKIKLEKSIALLKEIPENFLQFRKTGDNIIIDMRNMSNDLKNKFFGSLAKLNNLDFDEHQYGRVTINPYIWKDYIIIETTIGLIYGGPDDNYPWHGGSISQHQFYDMNGKLITTITDMDFGGSLSDFDKEKDIVVLRRHANGVDDEWDFPEPMIIVFEFLSGKKLLNIRTIDSPGGEIDGKYIRYVSDSGDYLFIDYNTKIVYLTSVDKVNKENYIKGIDDNNILFADGTKISLDDKVNVKRFSIDEWNTSVSKEIDRKRNLRID